MEAVQGQLLHQSGVAYRYRGRGGDGGEGGETSQLIAPSERLFRDATDVLRLRFMFPLFSLPVIEIQSLVTKRHP